MNVMGLCLARSPSVYSAHSELFVHGVQLRVWTAGSTIGNEFGGFWYSYRPEIVADGFNSPNEQLGAGQKEVVNCCDYTYLNCR